MTDDVPVRHVLEQGILQVETPVLFLQIVSILHNRAGGNDREAGVADGDRDTGQKVWATCAIPSIPLSLCSDWNNSSRFSFSL